MWYIIRVNCGGRLRTTPREDSMRRVLLFAQCQLSSWSTPGLVASREIYDSIFQSYSTFFLASLKVSLRETTYITKCRQAALL